MSICAIIPMFGFGYMTKRCIDYTLKNAGVNISILVVDDGSLEPFHDDRITTLRLEKNSGYTNATNQGILWAMKAGYEYVLLLNNDTEPEPDFVKYLLEVAEREKDAGVIGSTRIIYGESGTSFIENFGIDLISGYQAYTKTDIEQEIVTVAWVPVCSSLIPMSVIHQVGLLDRRMKIYCSDNDFCVRVHQLGYKVLLVPKSKVKHFHQTTTASVKCFDQATADQRVLLEKLSCNLQKQLLDTYPLDWQAKTWGKLEFTVYTKDKAPALGEEENDKLNQLTTA